MFILPAFDLSFLRELPQSIGVLLIVDLKMILSLLIRFCPFKFPDI